jgi:hypothetical protein
MDDLSCIPTCQHIRLTFQLLSSILAHRRLVFALCLDYRVRRDDNCCPCSQRGKTVSKLCVCDIHQPNWVEQQRDRVYCGLDLAILVSAVLICRFPRAHANPGVLALWM